MSRPGTPVTASELDVRLDTAGAQLVSHSATSNAIIVVCGPQATRYPFLQPSQPQVPHRADEECHMKQWLLLDSCVRRLVSNTPIALSLGCGFGAQLLLRACVQVTDIGEGGAVRRVAAAPDGTLAVHRNPRRLEFFEPRTRSLFVMVGKLLTERGNLVCKTLSCKVLLVRPSLDTFNAFI